MQPLTQKQNAIWQYITEYRQKHAFAPSFENIRVHFRFASPNAVTKHLQALAKKGYIHGREGARPREHRAITPVSSAENGIPVLGSIAAGIPLEAVENIESRVDLSGLGFDNAKGDLFILHVKGSSMIDAHIMNNDLVIIKQQAAVQPNDIAAVLWNGEATLKYVKRSGNNVILMPANAAMEPIVVRPQETESFAILGKCVGLIRK